MDWNEFRVANKGKGWSSTRTSTEFRKQKAQNYRGRFADKRKSDYIEQKGVFKRNMKLGGLVKKFRE